MQILPSLPGSAQAMNFASCLLSSSEGAGEVTVGGGLRDVDIENFSYKVNIII